MGVFISYSNQDEAAVRALASDLERARQTVWLDQELHGGDAWWQTILQQIRDAEVFVFALSNNSQRSKPCRAELEYARALRIPVLPVQIGQLDGLRAASIADLQIVDYRQRSADAGIGLVAAVQDAASRRGPLPEPLPDPPPIPFEYLLRLGHAIDAPQLNPAEQVGVLAQLRQGLKDEDDAGARRDIGVLLRNMRRRPDVTYASANEIDALLATIDAPQQQSSSQGAGWYPDPDQPQLQRYWDGTQWTDHRRDPRQAAPPGQPQQLQPQPFMQPSPATPPTQPPVLSSIAIALGVIAIFFLWPVFGTAGIICGAIAVVRKEKLGIVGLSVAVGGTILGLILALAVLGSL